MRFFIVSLGLVACVVQAAASESQPTLADYVKRSPAYVTGQIEFSQPHGVFHRDVFGRSVFVALIRPHQPIDIHLTESGISLTSKSGLRVSVAGIPVNITRLTYDDVTGEVRATSSVLGTRVGSDWIEARAEEAVERSYGPKLRKAFGHVRSLRSQNSLVDTNRVLNAIVHSFDSERKDGKPGRALPTFDGHLTLVTRVVRDQEIRVGSVIAEVEAGDRLSTTVMIHVPSRRKLQIRGVIFTSNLGVLLKNVVLHSFSATEESGFRVDAQSGIDGAITSAELVLSALAGHGSSGRATVVEDLVERKAQAKVSSFAVEHRAALVKAGLTPALIDALARDNSHKPTSGFVSQ